MNPPTYLEKTFLGHPQGLPFRRDRDAGTLPAEHEALPARVYPERRDRERPRFRALREAQEGAPAAQKTLNGEADRFLSLGGIRLPLAPVRGGGLPVREDAVCLPPDGPAPGGQVPQKDRPGRALARPVRGRLLAEKPGGGIYRLSLRRSVYEALIDAEKTTRQKGTFASGIIQTDTISTE
ncbi:MAG: hypothetical protein MZU97_12310 [Bacillus subtilis]|nr:hypothetical protein [Bacillus subtilis]